MEALRELGSEMIPNVEDQHQKQVTITPEMAKLYAEDDAAYREMVGVDTVIGAVFSPISAPFYLATAAWHSLRRLRLRNPASRAA